MPLTLLGRPRLLTHDHHCTFDQTEKMCITVGLPMPLVLPLAPLARPHLLIHIDLLDPGETEQT